MRRYRCAIKATTDGDIAVDGESDNVLEWGRIERMRWKVKGCSECVTLFSRTSKQYG